MTSLDRLPVGAPAEPPGHAEALASLRAGNAFTCALSDDPAERAALLQTVIDTAADMDTRFVHVGNPLRAPLTIERILLQAVGPEVNVRLERYGEALARTLARPVGDETRLVVVVEQAETLDPDALKLLREMAPSFGRVQPRVQMLFSGPQAFAAMLEPAPERVPNPPAPKAMPAPAVRPAWVAETPVAPRRSRAPFVLAIIVAALAGAGVLAWQREPEVLRRLGLPIPAPVRMAPQAEAAPPPASIAAPEAPDDTAALRREFDRFLSERPDAARLSDARKDELFQEFLDRRRARGASTAR